LIGLLAQMPVGSLIWQENMLSAPSFASWLRTNSSKHHADNPWNTNSCPWVKTDILDITRIILWHVLWQQQRHQGASWRENRNDSETTLLEWWWRGWWWRRQKPLLLSHL
jgi:hypothetical protein